MQEFLYRFDIRHWLQVFLYYRISESKHTQAPHWTAGVSPARSVERDSPFGAVIPGSYLINTQGAPFVVASGKSAHLLTQVVLT
jgi:hypothetical protein